MAELATATVTVDVIHMDVVKEIMTKQVKRIAELEVAIGKYQLTRSATEMFAMFDLVEKYK